MSLPASRSLAAAAVALTLAGALAACGGSSSGSTSAAATTSSGDAHTANITITSAKGCTPDRTSFAAGPLNVKITNQDATAVSEVEILGDGERIIGEKENLPPGFSGTFAVSLTAGTYTIYCPGAATETTAVSVTGTAAQGTDTSTTGLLAEGTKEYAAYVTTQMGYLLSSTQALDKALKGTDLTAAQNAYLKARPYYEKIEPVAESFTIGKNNLDADIDARAGDVPADDWTGFHPIEQGLFQKKSLKGLSTLGDGLVANVTKLRGLTKGLTYQPFELANGAQELLDEVSSSKITGEEERYSHIDLLDFQGNVEGAQQAFADLLPGLKQIDSSLADEINTNFTALNTLLNKYRSSDNESGFVLYGKITTDDRKQFASAVKNVQEPLSQVAGKVAH